MRISREEGLVQTVVQATGVHGGGEEQQDKSQAGGEPRGGGQHQASATACGG